MGKELGYVLDVFGFQESHSLTISQLLTLLILGKVIASVFDSTCLAFNDLPGSASVNNTLAKC